MTHLKHPQSVKEGEEIERGKEGRSERKLGREEIEKRIYYRHIPNIIVNYTLISNFAHLNTFLNSSLKFF